MELLLIIVILLVLFGGFGFSRRREPSGEWPESGAADSGAQAASAGQARRCAQESSDVAVALSPPDFVQERQ